MTIRSFFRSPVVRIGLLTFTFTIITPSFLYFYNFHSDSISNQSSDWVAFSRYLSPFTTLFSGCAIFLLTWYINEVREANEKDRNKAREATENERAKIEKPLITFRRTRKELEGIIPEDPFYEMINGGRSSALSCNVY